jgi:hypothetical protein
MFAMGRGIIHSSPGSICPSPHRGGGGGGAHDLQSLVQFEPGSPFRDPSSHSSPSLHGH